MRYRRGDWNPEGTKRFWGYIKGAEGWLSPERFEESRARTTYWCRVASNNPQLIKKLRQEHRIKRRNK